VNRVRRSIRYFLVGGLLSALPPNWCLASGLRTLTDGWLLDGADTARLMSLPDSEQTGVTEPPSHGGPGFWVAAGQSRLFGMPELPMTCLTLGVAGPSGKWRLGMNWQQMGRDFLVEDDLDLALRIGRSPWIGLRFRLRRWTVKNYPAETHHEPALEVGWFVRGPIGRWDLNVFWPAGDPVPWYGQRGRRPLALGKWSDRGAALALGIDLATNGTPQVTFQGLAYLTGGLAAGIRADPGTGSLGPTLAWQGGNLMLRTCHTVHPDLGVTHRLFLGFGDAKAALW